MVLLCGGSSFCLCVRAFTPFVREGCAVSDALTLDVVGDVLGLVCFEQPKGNRALWERSSCIMLKIYLFVSKKEGLLWG